jgi:hypothetical protein
MQKKQLDQTTYHADDSKDAVPCEDATLELVEGIVGHVQPKNLSQILKL